MEASMTAPAPPRRVRSAMPVKQARSEATLHRLLDAAEALITEKGLSGVSIPEIAARAGSSVGGFYARFRDKDELLRALEERFLGELRGLVGGLADPGRWPGAPVDAIVRAGVETLLRVFRERRALLAAFMARAARHPEVLEEAVRFRREVSARFVALLHERREILAHPDPDVAVDLAVQFAFGLTHQMAVMGEIRAAGRILDDEALARELVRNVLGYIGYPERVAAATS